MTPSDALALCRLAAALPVAALVLFAAAAATDALDGPLARRRGDASARGAALDPLADKALVLLPLAVLAGRGEAPLWALAALGTREAAVAALRAAGRVGPASPLARAKTAVSFAAVAAALAAPGALAEALLAAAAVLALASAAGYVTRVPERARA